MSRQLDFSKPLSDDDRKYALDRGMYAEVRANDLEHAEESEVHDPAGPEATGLTGNEPSRVADHQTPTGVGLAALTANPGAKTVVEAEKETPGPTAGAQKTGKDYNSWTVAELQQELENRELSKSGSKAELVARLEEDDKESE